MQKALFWPCLCIKKVRNDQDVRDNDTHLFGGSEEERIPIDRVLVAVDTVGNVCSAAGILANEQNYDT